MPCEGAQQTEAESLRTGAGDDEAAISGRRGDRQVGLRGSRPAMDPLIAILVVAYIILGFGIAYSTSVEITIDGPVTMFLIIRALLSGCLLLGAKSPGPDSAAACAQW